MLDVSSGFIGETLKPTPNVRRKFMMGFNGNLVDRTAYVTKWPSSFTKKWDEVYPIQLSIDLANEDGTFNELYDNRPEMRQNVLFQVGFDDIPLYYADSNHITMPNCYSTAGAHWYHSSGLTTSEHVLIDNNAVGISGLFQYIPMLEPVAVQQRLSFLIKPVSDTSSFFDVASNWYHAIAGYRYISGTSSYHRLAIDQIWCTSLEGFTVIESGDIGYNTAFNFTAGNALWHVNCQHGEFMTIDATTYFNISVDFHVWSMYTYEDSMQIEWYPAYGDTIAGWRQAARGTMEIYSLHLGSIEHLVNSSSEYLNLYSGKVIKSAFKQGGVTITVQDELKDLSEHVVGTNQNPVTFTNTNYLPSVIAWTLCTCYGELDGTLSSANVDIDYDSFSEWAAVWSSNAVFMQAIFEDIKVTEALRKIARMTRSAIYVQPSNTYKGRLYFQRFTSIDATSELNLNESNKVGDTLMVDSTLQANRQFVEAGWDATSDYFTISVHATNSASVNSYGAVEDVEKDEDIWYVDSASALDLAQRILSTNAEPVVTVEAQTTLVGLPYVIGDKATYENDLIGIGGTIFRIMSKTVDLSKGVVKFGLDASQIQAGFQLDVSTWDTTSERLV